MSDLKDNKIKALVCKGIAVCLALLVWQIAAMAIHQSILLVSPWQVFKRLLIIWKEPGFFGAIAYTFFHIVGGFLLGLVTGSLLAVLSGRFQLVEILLWPWMAMVKSVPVASFIVICLIWLSVQRLSIFISFLVVLPFVYQNMLTGIRQLDKNMDEMAKVFRIPYTRRLRYIIIPQLYPYFLTACTVTIGMSWKAGVAAEIIGTPNGSIGRMLYLYKVYLDTDGLLALTVVIVCLSVMTEKLFAKLLKSAMKVETENE